MSSKIRAVIQELNQMEPGVKVLVYSQFTSMLDLLEIHLKDSNKKFTRLDGRLKLTQRTHNINLFNTDPTTNILLLSLKCGSLGLNITSASRVLLIEPWWNPFVEEQAIDRVHRIGQTKEVKVTRFVIHNSVEERILELQEKKRLTSASIWNNQEANRQALSRLTLEDLRLLFGV